MPALSAEPSPEPAGVELPQWAQPYRDLATRIAAAAQGEQRAYALLTELCEDVGHRLSGSAGMERAVAWARARLQQAGHDNVRVQEVRVPHWVRGAESLTLLKPERRNLPMLALGNSVGTPNKGVKAELVVVRDRAGLEALGEKAKGKVVLFDTPMPAYDEKTRDPGYGAVVGTRLGAASWAATHGAVAMLFRSATNAKGLPHTGTLRYEEGAPQIPAAAIRVEDSAALAAQAAQGVPLQVHLKMGAHFEPDAKSGNVIAELVGRERSDEVVVIGGHLDSWDVGQGAHDNGSGVVIAMEALSLLRRLELTPRRTVRVVLWTNEENGLAGAKAYAEAHQAERHVAAVESDSGGAPVQQLQLDLKDPALQQAGLARLQAIQKLLAKQGVDRAEVGRSGADVTPLVDQGAAGVGLRHDMSHYFDLHHSAADTLEAVDPKALAQGVAAMAVLAYVLADMPEALNAPAADKTASPTTAP